MRILVACEFSGRVRNAFLDKGHDAYSCDLVPSSLLPFDRHIIGDVLPLLRERWDIVIAHPPCTYLCASGVRWLKTQEGRLGKMWRAREFFIACLNANADKVCVENPIMHRRASYKIPPPSQRIQPWQFGHNEQKLTCLWLKGLPKLKPSIVYKPQHVKRTHSSESDYMKAWGSKYRIYLRSITPQAVANAMADQWG